MPLDPVEHAELIQRLRRLGEGKKRIFRTAQEHPSTPTTVVGVTSNQQQRRSLCRSAAGTIFAHASRTLRRAGVHPVVVKDTLGHSKVDLAMNVYNKER